MNGLKIQIYALADEKGNQLDLEDVIKIIDAYKEQEDNGFFDEIMDDESDGEVYEKIKEIIAKLKEQEKINPLDEYIPMVEEMKQMMQGNTEAVTENEQKDAYKYLLHGAKSLVKENPEAIEALQDIQIGELYSGEFENFPREDGVIKDSGLSDGKKDEADILTLYYPQVDGVTPTVVSTEKEQEK